MIHKPKTLDLLENFSPERMYDAINYRFMHEQLQSSPMKNDNLFKEIEEAILETDTDQLRMKIRTVMQGDKAERDKISATFGLAEVIDPEKVLTPGQIEQDLFEEFESLPRIHLENHHRAASEQVHHFYREQEASNAESSDENTVSDVDRLWPDMETALLEMDIMDLRDSLKQIAGHARSHNYTVEELENYIQGEMSATALEYFEEELGYNPALSRDIDLLLDLDEAMAESDIMELRDALGSLMSKETSLTHSLEELEAYLYDELDEQDRESLASELMENEDLRSEIRLLRELDEAISEGDVMSLRNGLQNVSRDVMTREEKSLLPFSASSARITKVSSAAAILIAVLSLTFVIRYSVNQKSELAGMLHDTPAALTAFRTATPDVGSVLNQGFVYYNQSDFNKALDCFEQVTRIEQNNMAARFFAAASHQNLQKFDKAVVEYSAVINHNDNIFIEQSEWYRILCLIRMEEKMKAVEQLKAVVTRNGYYKEKAERLLKRLKKHS